MTSWTGGGRASPAPVPRRSTGSPTRSRPTHSRRAEWRRTGPVALLGDRRGLTALGAVTLVITLSLVGVGVGGHSASTLGPTPAACFVAACALAALAVHHEDLVAAVVMPPLLYVVVALAAGALSSSPDGGLSRSAMELATALILGAPVLLTATASAGVLAVGRCVAHVRRRAAAHRPRPAPARSRR